LWGLRTRWGSMFSARGASSHDCAAAGLVSRWALGVGRSRAHRVLGQGAQHRPRIPVPGIGRHRRCAVPMVLLGAAGGQTPPQHPGGAVRAAQGPPARGRGQLRPRVTTVVLDVAQTRAQGGPCRVGEHRLGRGRDRRGHHVAQPGVVLSTSRGGGHRVCPLLNVAAAEPARVRDRAVRLRLFGLLLSGGGGVEGTLRGRAARAVRCRLGARRLRQCPLRFAGGPQLALAARVGYRQAGGQHGPRDGGHLVVHLVGLVVGCAHRGGPS
jgi:hypothetical protein